MKCFSNILTAVILLFCEFGQAKYTVEVISSPNTPVVSKLDGTSDFYQSFNAAFISSIQNRSAGLIIRTQNCTSEPGGNCVHCSGEGDFASVLTFSELLSSDDSQSEFPVFKKIDLTSIVFKYETDPREIYGTEDPRIIYDSLTGLYFMFYTCYGRETIDPSSKTSVLLCLATSKDPANPKEWLRRGPVFPALQDSKSAVLIPPNRKGEKYTLIWGAGKIRISQSINPFVWPANGGELFLTTREGNWDCQGVESGPPPLKLSSGDLFWIYNSWDKQETYRAGFLILNASDPTQILQRSDDYFLEPTRAWEKGVFPYHCNVHNVVFIEAAHETEKQDIFRLYFGGADDVIGTALIQVKKI